MSAPVLVVQGLKEQGHKIRCIQAMTGLYRQTITHYLYGRKYKGVLQYRKYADRSPVQQLNAQADALKFHIQSPVPCTCGYPLHDPGRAANIEAGYKPRSMARMHQIWWNPAMGRVEAV